MRVSVAIATFNGAAHLQEQLDSFLIQTRQPDEVVICDDGSSDSTVGIAERFGRDAPFEVRIFRNESNVGFTRNFSNAMLRCTGDVLFLSDQDDVWFDSKIEVVLAAFVEHPDIALVVHDGRLVDENLQWRGTTYLGQVLSGFGDSDVLATGGLTAMRRSLAAIALPVPDGIIGHDLWIHYMARRLRARLVLETSLQLVRRHGRNTSAWVASSTQPINRWDVFVSQWRAAVAEGYEDRIAINSAAQLAFAKLVESGCPGFDRASILRGIEDVTDERKALIARSTLADMGALRRKLSAARLLIGGCYTHFNGYKSFLRDLVR